MMLNAEGEEGKDADYRRMLPGEVAEKHINTRPQRASATRTEEQQSVLRRILETSNNGFAAVVVRFLPSETASCTVLAFQGHEPTTIGYSVHKE